MHTNPVFIISWTVFFLFSCGEKAREEERLSRISELEIRGQQLEQQLEEINSEFNTFVHSVAQFENQFRHIHDKEIALGNQLPDSSPQELSEKLSEDVSRIENLISSNQQVISNLRAGLRNVGRESEVLTQESLKEREELEEQIRIREQTVVQLEAQMRDTQLSLKNTQSDLEMLSRSNEEQRQALNTAYYVMGNFKALKDEQILDKKGKFLGLFGGAKILRPDFNHQKFTRINIRETDSFPVEGKELTLVSVHPSESYTIEKEASGDKLNLLVSDPDKFWESSKYMVMLIK
ncbi:putative coiled-coil protein SlyX [Catalinimonas alkaloidigena]|uniref:Cbp1 family collagen-binding glycoprotein adhesin n=1 Tax=Catalinimonas alkaloidigena TaxID=1075417 RepID=UPI0024054FD1|nr:hypothetical protein [Catalinimonas alkaloidigena]MDF9797861.1 putative coiled-coil protein SlyX [Catalinimonas alkaloidigena]